jgi:predicted enzyme related to lactoylglutathione lyase
MNMKIKLTRIYVDDQEKALASYTERLGFQKKAEYPAGEFKWLTVASPEESDGVELYLEPNRNPAARALPQSLEEKGEPAAMFQTDDLQREYGRLVGNGVTFTMPPTKEPWGIMARLDDTCGNLIQLTQLSWRG